MPLPVPLGRRSLTCRIDEHGVLAHAHRSPGDGKNIYVLGARWIAEHSVASGDDDDIRLDHRGYGTHSRGGVRVGGVRDRDRQLTPPTDVAPLPPCELTAMNSNGYPAIWSAKLVSLTQLQVAAIEPVNVVMRVIYNTLDGIVNDYFVITASTASR
jgi:hypothetical protein